MKPNLGQEVRLWDLAVGRLVLAAPDVSLFSQPRFSVDESRLLVHDRLRGTRVWDTRDGRHVCDLADTGETVERPIALSSVRPDAAVARGQRVAIWDLAGGTERLTFGGHSKNVTALAFSPDGSRIVTGAGELASIGELTLWDPRSGNIFLTLEAPKGQIQDVAFSPDGSEFACVVSGTNGSAEVTLRNARTGAVIFAARGSVGLDSRLHFGENADKLSLTDRSGGQQEWDLRGGGPVLLRGQTDESTPLVFSLDGRRLFAVTRGGVATAVPARPPGAGRVLGPKSGVKQREVAIAPSGRVRAWDKLTGLPLFDFDGQVSALAAFTLSPDGLRLVGRTDVGGVIIWDADTGKRMADFRPAKGALRAAACSPDGSRAAIALPEPEVRLWDTATGRETNVLRGHKASVIGLTFSADGSKIVTTSLDRTVRIWDSESGDLLTTFEDQQTSFRSSSFSPDGERVVSVGSDWAGKVWDAKTGKSLFDLKGRRVEVNEMAFSPDGLSLTARTATGAIRLWDARTGEHLADLRTAAGPIGLPAVMPGGSRIAAPAGAAIKVWEARIGQELLTLEGGTGEVRRVAISPDGAWLAGVSSDGSVRIWEGRRRAEVYEFSAGMQAMSIAFSPDGNRVAACNADGALRVWDLRSRQEVFYNKGGGPGNWQVGFSSDGARVVASKIDARPKPGGQPFAMEKTVVKFAWDLSSEAALEPTESDAPDFSVNLGANALSPDGQLVAVAEGGARSWCGAPIRTRRNDARWRQTRPHRCVGMLRGPRRPTRPATRPRRVSPGNTCCRYWTKL